MIYSVLGDKAPVSNFSEDRDEHWKMYEKTKVEKVEAEKVVQRKMEPEGEYLSTQWIN